MGFEQERLARLKEFEGCVAWMYLDTRGNVTTWVGIELPTAERACQLPWHIPGDPQVADEREIAAAWARVKAMVPGGMPARYRAACGLELLEEDGDALLLGHLAQDDAALRAMFAGYDGFPEPVRLVLGDMAFNLGPAGFEMEFPQLRSAVTAGAWTRCAQLCHRLGVQQARNDWAARQFVMAAKLEAVTVADATGTSER